ncbi:coenzyme-B sulfoethylthiotransferase subunit alpha [Methanophagales archaeon]|nr:MAG: coenzyme-B sulfoethylthiotransferase subunit alpha [Methanophagales archaeon]
MPYGDIQHNFMKAMSNKFAERPEGTKTKFYVYGGWTQSKRKTEFVEEAKKLATARQSRTPGYNPDVGMPQGQRYLMPYMLNHTDIMVDADDLHFINNAAMQQAWDDIKRTIILGLDDAHGLLEARLGKEVTPDTISHYMEVLNHALPGGAVIQEHMVETKPMLVNDCYAKVFTGDDDLADALDRRFLLDINKEFPTGWTKPYEQADQLKEAIGKKLWQVLRMPTVVGRVCDGETMFRWVGMQVGMTMINAYKMCAGESSTGEFAYYAKHAAVVQMANKMPVRRERGHNEPGGLPLGINADCTRSPALFPNDPIRAELESIAIAALVQDQLWFGSYMSGGVGFTQYASATYTDNILEDFCYKGCEIGLDFAGAELGVPPAEAMGKIKGDKLTMDFLEKVIRAENDYALTQYEAYPTVAESHFGGSVRACCAAAGVGSAIACATGLAQPTLSGWSLSMLGHYERVGRLGFYGYDLQDQCTAPCSYSYQSDEGLPFEMRGTNYPNYAMNVGHQSAYGGLVAGAHLANKDAWVLSPLVKVAFADRDLPFDWGYTTREFGRGGLREFKPAGERDLIIGGYYGR